MAFKHFWVQYRLGNDADQAYIKSDSFVIGRAPECELPIPTDVISRRHLKVQLEEDKILVMDLGSTNGTFLEGERLSPNRKYEYKTGNRLYIDANKEVSLRITAIYQREAADYSLDKAAVDLARKKQELKGKTIANRRARSEGTEIGAPSQFLASAADSADNIFDNILFIAKSARFNKERQIKEAEHQSQELLDKAQIEIEEQREKFQSDILDLKVRTENEAKRTVTSANKKADKIIQNAEARVRQLKLEIVQAQKEARDHAENDRKKIIEEAQERHGEIIAEAHLKNRELQDANRRMEADLGDFKEHKQRLLDEIDELKKVTKEHEELALHTKKSYSQELSDLNALRIEVASLEKRNEQALFDLEKKIPGLKNEVQDMEARVVEATDEVRNLQEESQNIEKKIADSRLSLENAEKKSQAAEQRLDEIAQRVIEAEENLFKQTAMHQERNEAFEKQIEERIKKQKEIEEKVNEKILDKKEKAEREISVNLTNAKEKAQKIVDSAQERLDEVLNAANVKAEKTIKDAEESAANTLAAAEDKAHKSLSQAKHKSESLLADAKAEAHRVTSESDKIQRQMEDDLKKKYTEADARSKQLREEAEKFSKELRLEADEYRAKLKGDADSYSSKTRNEANAYSQNLRDEADKYKNQKKSEADDYSVKIRKEAEEFASQRKSEANLYSQEVEEKADSYNEKVKKEADVYAKKIQEDAEADSNYRREKLQADMDAEKHKLISDARSEAKSIVASAQIEAKEILARTQGEASDRIAELEDEIEKRKKETDEEINEIRTHAVKKLEEQKVQFEEDEKERTRVRVLKLRKELSDVLRARITPFLKDTDQIEKVSTILGKTINAIMLDEVDDDFLDAENFSDIDPTIAQKKNIKFFVASALAIVLAISVIYLLPTFKQMAKDSGRDIAAEMEKEQQEKIKRLQEAKEADRYLPEDDEEYSKEYKTTYTDRVLFTESYVQVELNKEFREKWILELQDFFIYELRLNENQLVPFIASEANLIGELDSAKQQISKQYKDQGIARMRQIEEEFMNKLRENLKKPSDLKRVMDFKKEFYQKNKALGL